PPRGAAPAAQQRALRAGAPAGAPGGLRAGGPLDVEVRGHALCPDPQTRGRSLPDHVLRGHGHGSGAVWARRRGFRRVHPGHRPRPAGGMRRGRVRPELPPDRGPTERIRPAQRSTQGDTVNTARLALREDAYYAPSPAGAAILTHQGRVSLTGSSIYQWIERLAPFLNGQHSLPELTAALSPERRQLVEQLVTTLLDPGGGPHPRPAEP